MTKLYNFSRPVFIPDSHSSLPKDSQGGEMCVLLSLISKTPLDEELDVYELVSTSQIIWTPFVEHIFKLGE